MQVDLAASPTPMKSPMYSSRCRIGVHRVDSPEPAGSTRPASASAPGDSGSASALLEGPFSAQQRASGGASKSRAEQRVEVGPRRSSGAARAAMRARAPSSDLAAVDTVLVLDHVDDAAVGAHLQPVERARRGEHRMARELPSMRRSSSGAERLAAAMQLKGAASFSTRGCLASGVSVSRGISVIAFSGQVARKARIARSSSR